MSSLPATSAPAGQNAVAADWALYSKVPGHKMDYDFLASTVDRGAAERCVRSLLTGHTNSPPSGRPDDLPWYSFSGQLGDQPAFALMEVAWSDERDGTGQPITPARLLATKWSTAAEKQLTFRSMAAMYFGLGWNQVQTGPPGVGNNRVLLQAAPSELDTVATDIDKEFEFVAGIAALLLDGRQVVLTSGEAFPPLPERIRLVDAVCALLPYAYRPQLSASTWANFRVRHKVRLTFAERAAEGQCEVSLDRRAVAAPQTSDGETYLKILATLRAKNVSTAQIVRHLAREHRVEACATLSDVLDLLQKLDMKERVQRNVRAGRGNLADVGEMLGKYGWDGLDTDDMRADYRGFLIERALSGPPDAPAAWGILDAFWTEYVANGFARHAHALLTAGNLDALRRLTTVVSQRAGALLRLVCQLTDAVTMKPDAGHVATHTELLATMPADIAADSSIHARFLDRPAAGTLLVSQLANRTQGGDRLRALLQVWRPLVTDERRWARPVVMAAYGEATIADAQDFDALRTVWPDGVLTVMGIAAVHGHLPPLFRVLWDHLVRLGAALLVEPGDQRRSLFRSYLSTYQAWLLERQWTTTEYENAARMDLLYLLAHGVPVTLDRLRGIPDSYLSAFRHGWEALELRRVREPLATRLRMALEPRAVRDHHDVANIRALIRMVDGVEPALRPWAAGTISGYFFAHLDQMGMVPLTDEWRALVDPYLRQWGNLQTLCRSDAAASPVVQALLPLLNRPDPPHHQLLDVVRPWLQVGRETRVLEVIAWLRFHTDASDTHKAFGVALQRDASNETVCRAFAPHFVRVTASFGPWASAIADELARDRKRQASPKRWPLRLDRFRSHRPDAEGPP